MFHSGFSDVVTADELARAARVPRALVDGLVAAGELQPIPGTAFFPAADAIRAGRRLRPSDAVRTCVDVDITPAEMFSRLPGRGELASDRGRATTFGSSLIHAAVLAVALWAAWRPVASAVTEERPQPTRMVFVMAPGPGGGGGGGGMRNPLPAPRAQRRGPERTRVAVLVVKKDPVLVSRRVEPPKPTPTPAVVPAPKPVEKAPEPLASRVLVAPVVAAAPNPQDREGVIEESRSAASSQGSGVGGGAGTGQGTGNGEGLGSGIGDGIGGGTGGGPFRPGSGIEPPQLLREVKAEYTEEGRRRGIRGDVVLEIVVTRAGTVGDVTVLQGLGAGLDQRAIAAVRQWRFSPARRRGEAVDVIVEVAVEFTLR